MFNIQLNQIIEHFSLEKLYMPRGAGKKEITASDLNRPALQLAGFFDYFDISRIQVYGKVEHTYVTQLSASKRATAFDKLFAFKFPAFIITRGIEPSSELMQMAAKHKVPVFRTPRSSSSFVSALVAFLTSNLAPRITRHGVLVEVYGEGVLILGESGVGKSETAVELVKRGHRLVADDAVEIKRVSDTSLVGTSPEIIRHFMEIRGIGIIDVKQIFGIGAVKDFEKIDLIIHMEIWQSGKHYDRLGLTDEFTNILDVDVRSIVLPVRPGRNLAIIVEIAAMNNRQKRMGYNAAEALNNRLIEHSFKK